MVAVLDRKLPMTYLVRIGDFVSTAGEADIAKIETRVLAAVHAGGAFLDVVDGDARLVRVLVTPSSPVRIEPAPHPVAVREPDELFPDVSFLDLDL